MKCLKDTSNKAIQKYVDHLWSDKMFQYAAALSTLLMTIFFGTSGFCVHVFYVTQALTGELMKFAALYKNLSVPCNRARRRIIIAAYAHLVTPCLMMWWPFLMYAHLPVCFVVHILHLSYVRCIFLDMGYHDMNHIVFLIGLNVLEFATNFVVMFNPQVYVAFAIATESLCPFLLSFRMKKKVGNKDSRGNQQVRTTQNSSSSPPNYVVIHHKRTAQHQEATPFPPVQEELSKGTWKEN